MASKYVVTPVARLAFPALFTPQVNKQAPNAAPMYGCTLLIPKNLVGKDKEAFDRIVALVTEAARDEFGDKLKDPKFRAALRNPVQDGDTKAEWDGYAGHHFVRCKSKLQPTILGADNNPIDKMNQDRIYAGCYVRANINAFAYDSNGNRGVSIWFNAIRFEADGEPFSGRIDAERTFGKPLATGADNPANYAGASASPFDT